MPSHVSTGAAGPTSHRARATGAARALADRSAVRYVVVGGCAFLIDLGVLALCYRVLGMPLWLATGTGFWTSFLFNFSVQRRFSFGSTAPVGASLWRYGALLVANTVITVVAVEAFERTAVGFAMGKVLITVAQTVWNYLIYRHWVFAPAASHAPPAAELQHRD